MQFVLCLVDCLCMHVFLAGVATGETALLSQLPVSFCAFASTLQEAFLTK
jgi:hypothetical protein